MMVESMEKINQSGQSDEKQSDWAVEEASMPESDLQSKWSERCGNVNMILDSDQSD